MKNNSFDNYKFFYESQGYGLFLEDLIIKDYVSWPMIVISVGNQVRKYVPEETINELHLEGLKHSKSKIKEKLNKIQEISDELREIDINENITKDTFNKILNNLSSVVGLYSYFDASYSEGIYQENPNDPRSKLIEKTKNVIRDDLDFIFFRENGVVGSLLKTIANQNNIRLSDVRFYRVNELISLFSKNKKIDTVEVKSRNKSYILNRDKNGEITFITGNKAKPILEKFKLDSKHNNSDNLKGVIAHGKGRKVKGNVYIIHRDYSNHKKLIEDMDNMDEGDILVTTITDPEFMPAIKKAGAIVTDIGGLLSHAAISARELDIPCIVGTENATRILKNKDKVEVDADEGIVKIIK